VAQWAAFEPVLLNLAESEDYALLTAALYDYAARLEADASEDLEGSAEHFRDAAKRVRAMIDDIERQLEANGAARREIEGGS
jgi:flagellar biosynthesis/type III secretory pathway ATPase